jgi:lia operon protein LiaG
MRSITRHAFTVAAVLSVSAFPLVASAQEKATLSGGEVAIYNLVGSIKAVGGGSGDVSVAIAKSGKDAGQLRVEQGAIQGRQTLRVIYPARRITFGDNNGWGNRTTLRVADDGTFDDNNDDGSRVEISGRSGGLEARADLTVTVPAGKAIHLHLAAGDVTVMNVNGDVSVGVDAADVTTSGTKGALTLDTGSGTVQITDAQGDVSIDCGSGAVSLSKIRGERLSVDAGSGRMRADGIDSKRIDLDLGSGGATLKNVTTSDLKLDSGSGATEIDLTSDIDRLDIDSGSGGITLWIPPTLGAKVDIDAGSGGIDMGVPVSVTRYESDHLVGTIGDGNGTIRIDAGSGGVHLRKRGS